MTGWIIFLVACAFVLSMIVAMLHDVDQALEDAELERRLDHLWDEIDEWMQAE